MVNAAVPSCHLQLRSSHGVIILIADPPSASLYGLAPVGLYVLSETAVPLYVTGWFPPKTTQVPLASENPPAQKVFEATSKGVATLVVRSYETPHAGWVLPPVVTVSALFSVSNESQPGGSTGREYG